MKLRNPLGSIVLLSVLAGCDLTPESSRARQLPLPPGTLSIAAKSSTQKPPVDGVVRVSASLPVTAPVPPAAATPPAQTFTPVEAVRFALENNPALQAVREQRGFAQGGLVIARSYQYNPVSQSTFFGATGEGVTNSLSQAHKITMDVEIRGQRSFRKEAAYAAITRTEWDIATQELLTAIARTGPSTPFSTASANSTFWMTRSS